MEIDGPPHLKCAFAFGLVAMPSPVVTLSEKPEGGVAQVCLPFLNLNELLPQNTEVVDKMRDSLGILVFGLSHLLGTDMGTEEFVLTRVWHKAETKVDHDGELLVQQGVPVREGRDGHPRSPEGPDEAVEQEE